MNTLRNTDVLSLNTNNSAHLHQYHYTLTKLAILLTTYTSSRSNSYAANVTHESQKGLRGTFNQQSQNITSVRDKQKRRSKPVTHLTLINYQSLSRISSQNFICNVFIVTFFFSLNPLGRFVSQTEILGNSVWNYLVFYSVLFSLVFSAARISESSIFFILGTLACPLEESFKSFAVQCQSVFLSHIATRALRYSANFFNTKIKRLEFRGSLPVPWRIFMWALVVARSWPLGCGWLITWELCIFNSNSF